MTHSFMAFGKELNQLAYADIVSYFAIEQVETDSLEFKSFSGKALDQERVIFEEICAMLNSDGGLIIWGAPKERAIQGKKEKAAQGALVPIPLDQRIEEGRFYNRMGGEITPLPSGVRFHELRENDQFIYVIQVEKSIYSPHQYDKRYYPIRMGTNMRAAPHHYVEALFKKIRSPLLAGKITDIEVSTVFEGLSTEFEITIEISNQTPYLNEENLYFTLTHNMDIMGSSERGVLVKGKEYTSIYREGDQSLSVYQARPILFYGDPYQALFRVRSANLKSGKTYEFVLIFGGKLSPLMRSEYTLRVEYIGGRARPYDLRIIAENIPLV